MYGIAPAPSRTSSRPRPNRLGPVRIAYRRAGDVLTRATGFMSAYHYTLNPYSGCSFGCTYCYAAFFARNGAQRDAWGAWVEVKENAVERLMEARTRLDGALVYMSSVTDPYQPVERKLELTRGLLQIMADGHRPRLVVQTRSPDVTRDADLFEKIVAHGGRVQVNLTVTTDDEDLRRTFEPGCPSNRVRLTAARTLRERGIDTCITLTPLLLVSDAGAFADALLETKVAKFIIQPFHFQNRNAVAQTRAGAWRLVGEKLGVAGDDFTGAYMAHYDAARAVLRERLPALGEGKEGFRPPF